MKPWTCTASSRSDEPLRDCLLLDATATAPARARLGGGTDSAVADHGQPGLDNDSGLRHQFHWMVSNCPDDGVRFRGSVSTAGHDAPTLQIV